MLIERHHHNQECEWEKVRYLAFSSLSSSINPFNGKGNFKVKKPADLFKLDKDNNMPKPVRDEERALKAIERFKQIQEHARRSSKTTDI